MALAHVYTHSFFDDLLGPGATVIDLGGNIGQFARQMVDRYRCRCVVFEPSPEAFRQIAPSETIEPHNLAVCGAPGTIMLNLSSNSEANAIVRNAQYDLIGQVAVEAVTLADTLRLAGRDRAELLKLDIEGSEIEVLDQADPALLRRFDQITVEFHDFCDMTPEATVRATIARVCDAGFHAFYFDRHVYRHVDVLFVNRARMGKARVLIETAKFWLPRTLRSLGRRITGRNG